MRVFKIFCVFVIIYVQVGTDKYKHLIINTDNTNKTQIYAVIAE